ncbi:MAG: hypothetical protein Q7R41_01595 [Phycisphaerales bacterium]|nr:hypothetical protein [Phycisphaerales bacterium]
MNRVIAFVLVALVGFASSANAQIRRQQAVQGPPANWLSVGVGAFSANSVSDGDSQTTWDFGNATSLQYRASLEKAFSNGISIGLAGTYVKAPIRYSSFNPNVPDVGGATCYPEPCDAEVGVYSLGINFEAGGGMGFHQVYGASVGMTRYDNFQRKSDDAELNPTDAVNAVSGTFSYGFGYRFSPRTVIVGVYDIGLVYHSRDGLTSDQRNTLVPRTIRVSLRQGFGNQGPVRRRR